MYYYDPDHYYSARYDRPFNTRPSSRYDRSQNYERSRSYERGYAHYINPYHYEPSGYSRSRDYYGRGRDYQTSTRDYSRSHHYRSGRDYAIAEYYDRGRSDEGAQGHSIFSYRRNHDHSAMADEEKVLVYHFRIHEFKGTPLEGLTDGGFGTSTRGQLNRWLRNRK